MITGSSYTALFDERHQFDNPHCFYGGNYDYDVFSVIEFSAITYQKFGDEAWKYIKERLLRRFYDEWFTNFIDGNYHTIKLEFYVEHQTNCSGLNSRFYIRGKHLVTDIAHLKILEPDNFEKLLSQKCGFNIKLREICSWCGNILVVDKRGACSACGGSPGK